MPATPPTPERGAAPRPRRALTLALALAGLLGCATGAPQEARDRSLAAYPARDQAAWLAALGSHTALLVARLDLEESLATRHGTATAITSDGYWLTAAHCLGAGRVTLVTSATASWADVAEAFVVWRGDGEDPPVDLALLHAPDTAGAGLDLSPTPAPGDAVLVAGHPDGAFPLALAAGEVLSVTRPEGARSVAAEVETSAPCREGDSGGPVVDPAGRLVAIAVSGRPRLFGEPAWTTRALRPDPRWLAAALARHRAATAARPR